MIRRAPAALGELTAGMRVYFYSPYPMKGRRRVDPHCWRGPATVIARESPGRYYIGWRARVLLVSKDQLRMATAEEAAAAEVIGKEADQHSQDRLHESCYDLTEEYRNPKAVRKHQLKVRSTRPLGPVPPRRLRSLRMIGPRLTSGSEATAPPAVERQPAHQGPSRSVGQLPSSEAQTQTEVMSGTM